MYIAVSTHPLTFKIISSVVHNSVHFSQFLPVHSFCIFSHKITASKLGFLNCWAVSQLICDCSFSVELSVSSCNSSSLIRKHPCAHTEHLKFYKRKSKFSWFLTSLVCCFIKGIILLVVSFVLQLTLPKCKLSGRVNKLCLGRTSPAIPDSWLAYQSTACIRFQEHWV